MASDVNFQGNHAKVSSSVSLSSSETIVHSLTSPTSPIQPIYEVDSMIDIVEESNEGGIFLFETERHLTYSSKYACTLCIVCIFGCWICTIPSVIVTIFARIAAQKNQISRVKVLFNIAFIFSFFGLILFAVQAGYLTWLIRYLAHRFLT
ncbi:unnamed protein product [Rotaria socialis]|uniref:Uncharacterized protein n=1 Tax=Rotaria socialis TaxID=392032 RepID=A0A817R1R2_9BILA|nr:unnamed protein product [Rotaria socialis]CAF3317553.1 unnamed protein product [Rotaria socialis]CAF3504932.1 unnamed protein product [Rotaria socialis]CAF3788463.1 unnamed protein product [Rotaria socialis]CAF4099243.1 unnamed protein product [Rotaria socialis]